jgi:hypothetical protein
MLAFPNRFIINVKLSTAQHQTISTALQNIQYSTSPLISIVPDEYSRPDFPALHKSPHVLLIISF